MSYVDALKQELVSPIRDLFLFTPAGRYLGTIRFALIEASALYWQTVNLEIHFAFQGNHECFLDFLTNYLPIESARHVGPTLTVIVASINSPTTIAQVRDAFERALREFDAIGSPEVDAELEGGPEQLEAELTKLEAWRL